MVQVNVRGAAAGAWMNSGAEVVSMAVRTVAASTFAGTEDGSAVVAMIGSMNIVVDDAYLLSTFGAVAASGGPDGGC